MTPPTLYLAAAIRGVLGSDGSHSFACIADAGHIPYGASLVETLPDRVRVHHLPLVAIASAPAVSDERLAKAGIQAGSSAGLTFVDVYFTRGDGKAWLNPKEACIASSNVWLTAHGWPVESPTS